MQSIGIWGLREEARKSWDHVVSDKVIYLGETRDLNLELPSFAEQYLNGDLWFELHLTCICQRESHVSMIWEIVSGATLPVPRTDTKIDTNVVAGAGRTSMLVERPELVQLPERVILESIPSEIRLKRVQLGCHCGWKQHSPVSPGIGFVENGEANLPLLGLVERPFRIQMGQSPRELVQTGAQATNEVSEQHRDYFRCGCEINFEDVERLFKVFVFTDGVGFDCPLGDFPFQEMEMFIRPTGLHFHEKQAIRSDVHADATVRECATIPA